MNKGIWYALGAYLTWGFFPIYWKALQQVPAPEILSHRIVWSLVFVGLIVLIRKDLAPLKAALQDRRLVMLYAAASALLTVNWLTYIWGVNAGHIVETSLGYFINPLVNVLLGVFVLRERLRPFQWLPVLLAAAGVLYLTVNYGQLPWIALTLAISFGLYGLLKKKARLSSVHGLTMETGIMFLPALGFLVLREVQGVGSFGHLGIPNMILLVLGGAVTAIPLLMFATAAPRINLSLLGLLQYTAPTIQFLLGVLLYNEPFTLARLIGFSLIWIALGLYTLESLVIYRRGAILKQAG